MKEQLTELIAALPRGVNVNEFIAKLVKYDQDLTAEKKEWVGFTQEEVKDLIRSFDWRAPVEHFVASLEARLKEKNS